MKEREKMSKFKPGWYKITGEKNLFKVLEVREDTPYTDDIVGYYRGCRSIQVSSGLLTDSTFLGLDPGKWVPFKKCNLKVTDFAVKARGCNNSNEQWIEGILRGIDCQSNRYLIENYGWFKHCEIWEPLP